MKLKCYRNQSYGGSMNMPALAKSIRYVIRCVLPMLFNGNEREFVSNMAG